MQIDHLCPASLDDDEAAGCERCGATDTTLEWIDSYDHETGYHEHGLVCVGGCRADIPAQTFDADNDAAIALAGCPF